MPTLPELLNQLQFISQDTVLLGLFITGAIILAARDWRFLIMALLIQYILIGLLLSRLVRPDIAVLKVMIGAFICPILFLSARQVSAPFSIPSFTSTRGGYLANWPRKFSLMALLGGRERRRDPTTTGFVFRGLAALIMILVATTLSSAFTLSNLSPNIVTAVYWLVLVGLVTLTLTEDPIKVGHGLFTVLGGFELFYATIENSLLLTGLWGAINLLIALTIGYLTVVKGAGPEEER